MAIVAVKLTPWLHWQTAQTQASLAQAWEVSEALTVCTGSASLVAAPTSSPTQLAASSDGVSANNSRKRTNEIRNPFVLC